MIVGLFCVKECLCYKDRVLGDCLFFDEFGVLLICLNIEFNVILEVVMNEINDVKGI